LTGIRKSTGSRDVGVSAVGSRDAADAREGLVPHQSPYTLIWKPVAKVLAEAKKGAVQ
jgi:hypothetical protein